MRPCKLRSFSSLACLGNLFLLIAALLTQPAFAQVPAFAQGKDRLTAAVDNAKLVALPNHHPLWASPANSSTPLAADQPFDHMTLVLARSPEQEAAFQQFLASQQNPSSPNYHHWLTPTEVGDRFGLSPHDIATLSNWIESQGLHVNWVSPSRIFINFGGPSASVAQAFHTELRSYRINGAERLSVSSDPMIPAAIAPAIKAIHGLYTLEDHPYHSLGTMASDSPLFNSNSGVHFLSPADFATIYDVPSSLGGSGQTIAILGRARVNPADITNFIGKTFSNMSLPTEIVPTAFGGVDPGPALTTPPTGNVSTGDQSEATLDVTRSGSVAPGANLELVVATSASGGIEVDAQYVVQTTPVAQIMTISFGACESAAGSSNVGFWDSLFGQAAAEGISTFVSSGDSGASGCDSAFATPPVSPKPNSPNYICSSSYVTCVGGTEFNDASNPTAYWNTSNNSDLGSAISYIPEGGWNEPLNSNSKPVVASGGGGVSTVISTPPWQVGDGVPTARAGRYTPDISFSAAGHDGYFACLAFTGGDCVSASNGVYHFIYFSGTSAAAPSMAGIAAILNQKLGKPQGNLNPELYSMASFTPAAFHDATIATSGVANCSLSTPSMCNNSIPGPTAITGGQSGFSVGDGYDEVTGLGSLDVNNFLGGYTSAAITPAITLTPSPTTPTSAQAVAVTITVGGGAGNPTPTGSLTLSTGQFSAKAISLTNGSTTATIPAGTLSVGDNTLVATYQPDGASSATYLASSASITVTVTAAPTFAITTTAVTVTPGASTNNQSTLTLTPSGGFTGSVGLTAKITSSPLAAQDLPTLSFGTSNTVSITGSGPATATLTISTTRSAKSSLDPASRPKLPWTAAGGATLACILLLGIPARRRNWRTLLGVFLLLASLAGGITACGGGGGGGTVTPVDPGTTPGSYVITVTGTAGSTTTTGTVNLTVQ